MKKRPNRRLTVVGGEVIVSYHYWCDSDGTPQNFEKVTVRSKVSAGPQFHLSVKETDDEITVRRTVVEHYELLFDYEIRRMISEFRKDVYRMVPLRGA